MNCRPSLAGSHVPAAEYRGPEVVDAKYQYSQIEHVCTWMIVYKGSEPHHDSRYATHACKPTVERIHKGTKDW